jgi:hypothetical protein
MPWSICCLLPGDAVGHGLTKEAIELLRNAGAELADIRRARDYMFWRADNEEELGEALAETEPFKTYSGAWIFTEKGGCHVTDHHLGDWAIDQLFADKTPEDILVGFEAEVQRNASTYVEVSPVFGVQIASECELADGVRLVPADAKEAFAWGGRWAPKGTCYLCQSFEVKPAFEAGSTRAGSPRRKGKAKPDSNSRDAVRHRVRLACLLATAGAVEFPVSFTADNHLLFSSVSKLDETDEDDETDEADRTDETDRPMPAHPQVSLPADETLIKTVFGHLSGFSHYDSLERAILRLGRARMAKSPVDKALELGIAAEIALTHGDDSGNAELTFKLCSRAAWLLGQEPVERARIFDEMKQLYHARSQAVHSGVLSARSRASLEAGHELVARMLTAIVQRGRFPKWANLVMGGEG